jgi:hypothetical protein
MKKYILLIDPMMESPPHITTDKTNGFNFISHTENIYVDFENKIYMHVMRENIIHDAYTNRYNMEGYNITEKLSELIDMCKDNYINLIYHDFSGRQLLPIYSFHEEQIGDHANHIILGLGAQGDFGCYFDLTSDIATFSMKSSQSPQRRMFIDICSPRYYLKKGFTIDKAQYDYSNNNFNVIREQFNRICKDKFDELVSQVFYKLRFLKQLQNKDDTELSKINMNNLTEMYGVHLGLQIYQHIEDHNFDIAFIEAVEIIGPQYNSLCIHNRLQMDGTDLLYHIVSNAKDDYSWATELRKYINYEN